MEVSDVSVLIVDDDIDIRQTLEEILRDEGYSVACATNGREALERLRSLRPRMILLDLSMPVMDGVAFRQAQRSDPLLAKIPTVVMTAADRMQERTAGMQLADCLAKPLRLDELLRVVARLTA